MRVRYLRPAEEEYLEAVRYYSGRARDLGAAFLDDLGRTEELLAAHPQLGSPYGDEARRLRLRRFPYSLLYVLQPDAVLIVAVRHHRQQPVSWRDRL